MIEGIFFQDLCGYLVVRAQVMAYSKKWIERFFSQNFCGHLMGGAQVMAYCKRWIEWMRSSQWMIHVCKKLLNSFRMISMKMKTISMQKTWKCGDLRGYDVLSQGWNQRSTRKDIMI